MRKIKALFGKREFPINWASCYLSKINRHCYEMKTVYWLKIQPNENGFFHAIINGENVTRLKFVNVKKEEDIKHCNGVNPYSRMIVSTSEEIIKTISGIISPSNSKTIVEESFAVLKNYPIGYSLENPNDPPYLLLEEDEFDTLIDEENNPFVQGNWVTVNSLS
jgi:hypothetical protein